MNSQLVSAAHRYLDFGLNPLPLKLNKTPALPRGHNFLYEVIDNIENRFEKAEMIGVACGKVSDGFYCLDFDCHQNQDISPIISAILEDDKIRFLLDESALAVYTTRNNGVHFYFLYTEDILKHKVLAYHKGTHDTLLELRGNGQYAVVNPSMGYDHVDGAALNELSPIDTVTYKWLFEYLSSFGDAPEDNFSSFQAPDSQYECIVPSNEAKECLIENGWTLDYTTKDEVEHWRRPGKGKDEGISATFNFKNKNRFYVFSSNASPFKASTNYSPFDIMLLLKYKGNLEQCEKAYIDQGKVIIKHDDKEPDEVDRSQFPTDVFPPFLEDYILSMRETLNYHVDFSSCAAMFSMSALCGNKFKSVVKSQWTAVPLFWFACVGYPGMIKSHPLSQLIKPIKDFDALNYKDYEEASKHWNPSEKQPKPKFQQILVSDTTVEALQDIHKHNPRGLGMYRDELKGFIGDMNKYRMGGSDEQFWLESFNNGSSITNRLTRDPIYVPNMCINIIGTIQHDVLDDIITQYKGSGFIDRFLYATPPKEIFPLSKEEINSQYADLWSDFLKKVRNQCNYLDYQDMSQVVFTQDAFDAYLSIDSRYVEIQKEEEESEDQAIGQYLSKMKTYIPRFALLMCLFDHFSNKAPLHIKPHHVELADKIGEYFIESARVTFNDTTIRSEIRRILQTLKGKTRNMQIKCLHDIGISQKNIGKYFRISRQTVHRCLKKQG